MTYKDAIITCSRKALTFSGRASRAEFWVFYAGLFIAYSLYKAIADQVPYIPTSTLSTVIGTVFLTLKLCFLLSLIFLMRQFVRRFHDLGFSGLFAWIQVIPVVLASTISLIGYTTHESGADAFIEQKALETDESGEPQSLSTMVRDYSEWRETPAGRAEYEYYVLLAKILQFGTLTSYIFHGLTLLIMLRPSQPGSNTYGPNPHEVST